MLFPAPASAAGKPVRVRVIIAGKELISAVSPVADDTEVYAPLEILKAVDANGQLSPHGDTVIVTEQSTGRSLELALARVNGSEMIALSDLGHVVDGVVVRSPAGKKERSALRTVYFAARISNIRMDGNRVQVETSFPVQYKVDPPKPINGAPSTIDCDGAVLDGYRPAQQIVGVRSVQLSPSVVRIEVALPRGVMVQPTDGKAPPARAFSAAFVVRPMPTSPALLSPASGLLAADPGASTIPDEPNAVASHRTAMSAPVVISRSPTGTSVTIDKSTAIPTTGARNAPSGTAVVGGNGVNGAHPDQVNPGEIAGTAGQPGKTVAPPAKPIEVRGFTFITDNTSRARIELDVSGKANAIVKYVPGTTQMNIDITNAVINLPDQDTGDRNIEHPLVNHASIGTSPDQPGSVRVQIDTTRIVGYTLNSQPDRLTLDLRIPRNATGALSDKLVVVDAGHGGAATGAAGHGPNGTVYEKTITLAIAMRLRALLEQCGARVVVTRDSDVDIPLYDRPKLANTIGADLFISIHNDSTPHTNSASGTTTYYHGGDPSSRALANCVQDAVRSVTGLPSKGALSDNVLYASGLAVLRNSTMPAVLCEVAYINNSGDRSRLVDPAFQEHVAQAMCDGLRTYVEGQPRSNPALLPRDVPVPDSVTLRTGQPVR